MQVFCNHRFIWEGIYQREGNCGIFLAWLGIIIIQKGGI